MILEIGILLENEASKEAGMIFEVKDFEEFCLVLKDNVSEEVALVMGVTIDDNAEVAEPTREDKLELISVLLIEAVLKNWLIAEETAEADEKVPLAVAVGAIEMMVVRLSVSP